MPASRPGRTSPVIADIGMSAPTEYNTEFDLFDSSDDGSPLPGLNLEASPDTLQSLDTTGSGEGKGFLSPKASLAIPQSGGDLHSPSGSQDSTSDSSSSKRTQSSASTKTSFTAGNIVMTDGLDIKSEWKPEDFINADEDQTFTMFDGTIDPSSIENTFDFGDRPLDGQFDFNSASSSPSPFGITATDATSPPLPDFRNPHPKTSPLPGSTLPRGHNKAYSQYSLTQSMNGLNTSGSREVSPTSNLVTSQDSSPSALFNNSPSPGANYGLNSLPNAELSNAAAMWSSPQFGGHIQPGTVTAPPFGAMPAAGAVPQMPFAPQFFTPGSYSLRIHPTPLKSRVETQIPIKMTLSSLPPGIKRLHLPAHTISKPKLMVKPRPERCPDMLELHTALVCTSAMQNSEHRKRACERARTVAQSYAPDIQATEIPDDEESKPQNGAEVQICSGCVTRERKRAARKKLKKVEDEELWNRDENRRVIVFNTQEIKEWQLSNPGGMEPSAGPAEVHIDAPMRIACYCRHHGEKLGFQVIFTITDFRGQLVAQAMSSSIMITDDHKTHTLPPSLASSSLNSAEGSLMPTPQDGNSLSPGTSFRLSHSSSDLPALAHAQGGALSRAVSSGNPSQANSAIPTPRNLSRPASPTLISAPSSKKRKASGSAKVPSGLAMTRLETAHLPASQPSSGQMGSTVSTAVSPFSPNLPTFPLGPDPLFGQNAGPSGTMVQPFPAGPPTPNSNDHGLFTNANRSASLENLAMSQMYSAPASAHPSRAPSPNGLRNSAAAMQQQANFAQALANSLYTLPIGMNSATRPPVSVIHKIIPNEGPKSGGIEVTILGSGFYQGLEVMFGDIKATTTTFWGESSLVCLLPPSPSSGNVLVTFKQHTATTAQPFSTKPQPVFRYLDDDEQQLMRTALTVLAHKMNGNFEDVADVARRIIGDSNPGWGAGSSAPGNQRGGGAGFNSFAFTMNLETQLLKLLDLLDVDDSTRKARYNLRRSTGQTMLHLACSLGLHRFVAGLLARGAYCDLRDKGGYTPLHMASLNNHPEIVRRLIYAGADPTIRTLSGLTAADVARSREVIRAIRRMERHVRSRSGGSLHSRANSANSLRSLWDPLSPTQQSRRCSAESSEADEESPEYSSENAGSEEEDVDDGPWISARRRSSHEMRPQDNSPAPLLQPQGPDMAAGLASPTAAMSAFKEQFAAQFQQLQQAMALQLQNLPQFPYLPQMPNFSGMPPLPDYQAYLYSAPVIQRITSLVPNIGGSRPGSAGDQSPPKEMDGRWWDLSSLMASSAPPPAYDDIFPQSDLDRKQASAAQAAAEAEADSKCAGLYDVATASSATRSPALQDAHQLPDLLQIGRKNAITKEQQENLRRAHARKLKRLSRDRNLFFIWIPLLLVVLSAMLYSKFPGPFSALWGTVRPLFDNTWIAGPAHDRVVEVL